MQVMQGADVHQTDAGMTEHGYGLVVLAANRQHLGHVIRQHFRWDGSVFNVGHGLSGSLHGSHQPEGAGTQLPNSLDFAWRSHHRCDIRAAGKAVGNALNICRHCFRGIALHLDHQYGGWLALNQGADVARQRVFPRLTQDHAVDQFHR